MYEKRLASGCWKCSIPCRLIETLRLLLTALAISLHCWWITFIDCLHFAPMSSFLFAIRLHSVSRYNICRSGTGKAAAPGAIAEHDIPVTYIITNTLHVPREYNFFLHSPKSCSWKCTAARAAWIFMIYFNNLYPSGCAKLFCWIARRSTFLSCPIEPWLCFLHSSRSILHYGDLYSIHVSTAITFTCIQHFQDWPKLLERMTLWNLKRWCVKAI